MKQLGKKFFEALIAINRVRATQIFDSYLQEHTLVRAMDDIIVPALDGIGQGWQEGRYSLAQIYLSGRITEELVRSAGNAVTNRGSVTNPEIAVAVLNDQHQLGKRLVMLALHSAGIYPRDYDTVGEKSIIDAVIRDNIKILLVSVLMYNSALLVKPLVGELQVRSPHTKVIVGGAPFRLDPGLYKKVGAHGMGKSAADAIYLVKEIIGHLEKEENV